jgi:hypothetical protein
MPIDNGGASQFTIRTSDRRTFRRCLRKWDWQSSLRQNLRHSGTEQNINFWFGSAIHFCMEDYEGLNRFEDPRRALYAYYHAFNPDELPLGAEMHYSLGISMLTYYMTWKEKHNKQTEFETVWLNPKTYEPMLPGAPGAIPAVEIAFYIPLNVYTIVDADDNRIIDSFFYDGTSEEDLRAFLAQHPEVPQDWDPTLSPEYCYMLGEAEHPVKVIGIFYHGTIDRIVVDRYGRYWLWDYKTAKKADTAKLATDDQVSAYLWGAAKLFPFKVYGFVYLQMTKEKIKEPKRLKSGELSVDKRQKTTYSLLRQAILEDYETVQSAPAKLVQFLNFMAEQEEPEGDRFIRWDFVKRTPEQIQTTEENIYGELADMLNPNKVCYPTPTRDCSWDCPFREACILTDMKDDYALSEFFREFETRPHEENGNEDEWRTHIEWPDAEHPLIPMETVMNFDSTLVISESDEDEPTNGFEFYYEEEC